MKTLRIILGDQLSQSISSLHCYHPDTDLILMCEVWKEATYVKHHKKKIAFLYLLQVIAFDSMLLRARKRVTLTSANGAG